MNFDLWLDDLFGLYAKALKPDSQTFIMFPYEDLEWAVDFLSSEEVNQPLYETVMRNANQNENQGKYFQERLLEGSLISNNSAILLGDGLDLKQDQQDDFDPERAMTFTGPGSGS